jgi:hypothetical protein
LIQLDPCLSPHTSINSNWIKDLNIRPEALKLVQEGAGNTLELIGIGKDFLKRTSETQRKNGQMGLHKTKNLLHKKEMVSKLRRPPTERERIFTSYTSDKGLITGIYRELKELNFPKIHEPIKKLATELNSNGQKTHEKLLTISSHKGNANQNYTKIPPHPC